MGEDTKLNLLFVAGNAEHSTARNFLVVDLKATECGIQMSAPIDKAVRSVNKPLIVQTDKGFDSRCGTVLVHGEGFSRPIHGASHEPLGIVDSLMILVLPVPNQLSESIAAEINSGLLLLTPEHIFDNGLGRNTSMIAAGNPESIVASV